MRRIVLALAGLGLIGAAPGEEDPRQLVTIRVQPMGLLCAGLCPEYKLDISDGWVMGLRDFNLDSPAKPVSFRIDHAQYARFRERLARVRPTDARDTAFMCETGETGGMMREVLWFAGQEQTLRAVSCAGHLDPKLECAVNLGLIEVGINPFSGDRIGPGQSAQAMRDHLKESRGCE